MVIEPNINDVASMKQYVLILVFVEDGHWVMGYIPVDDEFGVS